MKNVIWIVFLLIFAFQVQSQDKRGYTWIIGSGAMYAKFYGDTTKPNTGQLFTSVTAPNYPYIFSNSHSNICDSSTGDLLFMCNGMRIYDTLGNIMDNGDSLQPYLIYQQGTYPFQPNTQGSIILPKGNNGKYYVFIPTISDSAYSVYVGVQEKVPYDLILYHVVDMNANGGLGKVISKNNIAIKNVELCKVGLMACRHANGKDWWLLKQSLDTNSIYTFLVTEDTVELKYKQLFSEPQFGFYDRVGQSSFNTKGEKYVFATGGGHSNGGHLYISNFDRCTGLLSQVEEIQVPLDSSKTILDSIFGPYFDSLITGVCFSENDKFLYVTRRYNVYQYDLFEPNPSLRWNLIQNGPDTIFTQFVAYGQMQRGPDNRIYIGKSLGSSGFQASVIDHPNEKGSACNFCKRCLRYDIGIDNLNGPPNMPDFNLGKLEPCWPLASIQIEKDLNTIEIYPNPSSEIIYIRSSVKGKRQLFSIDGQLLISTTKDEIDVTKYKPGIYFLRIGNATKKVSIE